MAPAEGGPTFLKLKSSWRPRRQSKILAVRGVHGGGGSMGGGGSPPHPTVYGPSNTSRGVFEIAGELRRSTGPRREGASPALCMLTSPPQPMTLSVTLKYAAERNMQSIPRYDWSAMVKNCIGGPAGSSSRGCHRGCSVHVGRFIPPRLGERNCRRQCSQFAPQPFTASGVESPTLLP